MTVCACVIDYGHLVQAVCTVTFSVEADVAEEKVEEWLQVSCISRG